MVWQTKDITDAAQYSSPIIIENGGKRQCVQLLSRKIIGIDAKDGSVVWKADFEATSAVIPTPIHKDREIYVTAGYGIGCMKLKLGGAQPEVVYENNVMVNHHGGVILIDGKLYGHSDKGGWTCQDFATGERCGRTKRWIRARWATPGYLICLEEKSGNVALVQASTEGWKEKARFKLEPQTEQRKPQGRIWVHPSSWTADSTCGIRNDLLLRREAEVKARRAA